VTPPKKTDPGQMNGPGPIYNLLSKYYLLAGAVLLAAAGLAVVFTSDFLESTFLGAAVFATGLAAALSAGLAVLEVCAKEPKEITAAAKTRARLLKLFIVFVF